MFSRMLTNVLLETARTFPAVLLTGPRQSGKTTLLKQVFPDHRYISLETPDTLLRIQSDPRGFLFSEKSRWIIDEAQNFPDLFSWVQEEMDAHPEPGRFIFSGSQNFLLNEKISQTLAGRVAILELLPLSYEEYASHPKMQNISLWEYLYRGSYPRPWQESIDPTLWYSSYIRTYLERDVRSLINVRNLSSFQLFLKLCAGRHGQLLNLNGLANDCGISQTTATQWLSILEASYIIYRLRPHYQNFNKRLVKTDKLFFYDSAIVCHLLGIDSPAHLQVHSHRGAIFEGFVLAEILKFYAAIGKVAPVYFWRDHTGTEVDFLLEKSTGLVSIEAKSTTTFNASILSELKKWTKLAGEKAEKGFVVYGGKDSFNYEGVGIVAWHHCAEILSDINA